MKKILFLSAMMMAGAPFAATSIAEVAMKQMEVTLQEEKTQIKPDELPDPVKQTIAGDETLKEFPVSEAWKIKLVDETLIFKVAFDNGTTDKLWKSYTSEGKEVTK